MTLKRHLRSYAVVGLLQWLLEYTVMLALSQWLLPAAPANLLGRIAGACLGFWLNGRFTFADAENGSKVSPVALRRFLLAWLGLTLLNTAGVALLEQAGGLRVAQLGKPAADVVCAVAGFLLARHWIYLRQP